MKNQLLLLIILFQFNGNTYAQGEQNMWAFGDVGLDFNSGSPVYFKTSMYPAFEGAASVCDGSGKLLFYTNGYWVWNAKHELMPEFTGGVTGVKSAIFPTVGYPALMESNGAYPIQPAAICNVPSKAGQYYVFSLSSIGQLFYSVIDMKLNAGMGGIVSGKKGIFLMSGLTQKLTVVKGCNNNWVMVRSKAFNEFKALEVNDTGLVKIPAVSYCGKLPVSWYQFGVIKFSPDGKKMAASSNKEASTTGGLELYDFDFKTGKLSEPSVLDSGRADAYYYGACFSGDNSKLYATTSSYAAGGLFYPGLVKQFNLALPSSAAVAASKTDVFTNTVPALNILGDLKRSPDGRIYFGNGRNIMHCIDKPDLAGFACNPIGNIFIFPSGSTEKGLPNDVAIIAVADTVKKVISKVACFIDSLILTAPDGKYYSWEDGSKEPVRKVTNSGTFILQFLNAACNWETDTFKVAFIRLPVLKYTAYSCSNTMHSKAWVNAEPGQDYIIEYNWKDNKNKVIRTVTSSLGDSIKGLDTGRYYLNINTQSGCDTTLSFYIKALPQPIADFEMDPLICSGDTLLLNNKTEAPAWKWYFDDGTSSSLQHPFLIYADAGMHTVKLTVSNMEGCIDTLSKNVTVRTFKLDVKADRDFVEIGAAINVEANSSEDFIVKSWSPAFLFEHQDRKVQLVLADTSTLITVTGASALGCKDTASVLVNINPYAIMPNAFTPNGDGVNDRFRPVSTGRVAVSHFEIYNRYGQKVFSESGAAALEGWNGCYLGKIMELGTYYYQISIMSANGTIKYIKGDVNLLH